jgi:hypothetical protein
MTRRALVAVVLLALSAGSALAQNPTPEAGVRDSIRDMVSRIEALEAEVAAELEAAGEVEGDEQMGRTGMFKVAGLCTRLCRLHPPRWSRSVAVLLL